MFAKLKLAAAVLAAAMALAMTPLPATAKTNVHVGVGIGVGGGWGYPGWGYGRPCWNTPYGRCGWAYPRYYRPYYGPTVNYYYGGYPYGYNPPAAYRVSCGAAKSIVYRSGYGRVGVVKCGGKYHVFNATRTGHVYTLRVNSWNGGVVVVARR